MGFTFPLIDPTGQVVGVQIRTLDGFKCMIAGSSVAGMFLPTRLDEQRTVFSPEGASDCAALNTLGLQAIGRFSKNTSPRLVARFVRSLRIRRLIAVADLDPDDGGIHSARRLATYCGHFCQTSLLIPKEKDCRSWVRAGASRADIIKEIKDVR